MPRISDLLELMRPAQSEMTVGDLMRPATVNQMMMSKALRQRQANPRQDIRQLMDYPENWQQFGQNVAQQFPIDTPENVRAAAQQLAMNMGPQALVYHGSPHKFAPTPNNPLGEFDASKIGTGEGAQSFGRGTYLAEAPDVARTYAADRAYVGAAMSGKPKAINFDDPAWIAQKTLDELGDAVKAKSHLEMVQRTAAKYQPPETKAAVQGAIDLISAGKVSPKGSLYKADLPDAMIPKMLDWDKPLSQQSAEVQKAFLSTRKNLTPMDIENLGGRAAVNQLYSMDNTVDSFLGTWQSLRGSKDAGEKMLRDAGIPGIRYLDGGSRGAGSGTSNYVVFPGMEKQVKILERN